MKKMIKRKTVILCMLLLGISVSGCGKTREVDEASSKVIQISVAPEETSPTPAPDQVASVAVTTNFDIHTTNGNLTMVNTYLAEQDAAGISFAESSDSQSDADSTDNSGDSADNNEQDSSTSDTEE